VCDPAAFSFETTATLTFGPEIIGQPRGTRAIEFGIDIDSAGYNIFVLGEEGTGRTTAIDRFLRERAANKPVPQDWVYVNNFSEPHKPRALNLPAGLGVVLRGDMAVLVDHLRLSLPQAFDQDAYLQACHNTQYKFEAERDSIFSSLESRAAKENIGLARAPQGWGLFPVRDGRPLTSEAFQALSEDERVAFDVSRRALERELESAVRAVRDLEKRAKDERRTLDQEVAASVVDHEFEELKAKYAAHAEALVYLYEMRLDILEHFADFLPSEESAEDAPGAPRRPNFRKYAVNVAVDHSHTQGAPVIVELNPTFPKLLGRIEHEARFGSLSTDFTLIKTGALHAANGGYLVLRARDVFYEPMAWDALKRSLLSGYVRTEDIAVRSGMATTITLDPEPIPLDLKVVLVGSAGLYYYLLDADEDFGSLFKVKADFATDMPRTPENERQYALFIAARCAEEKLRPFDRSAVAKVIEYGSRAADDQSKLTVCFGAVTDLLREADYGAGKAGRVTVMADDVRAAIQEKNYRTNETEELLRRRILEGTVFVDTQGTAVGQINALSISSSGDYTFGLPSRVTARAYVGHGGIGQIDRETNMAGPIHNKGLLTLTSFFNALYASHRSVSFSAQITFEQNYGGIDGDSASCAELYALLSSLSGYPIKQSLAVTGSVNQKGEVQPIGAVNEKIEGFFEVCAARGLTGDQGVLIPAMNVRELMLNEKVIAAVEAGKFHIWPVTLLDEGIEILTGVPAGVRKEGRFPEGTVHGAAQKRLRELGKGHDHSHEDDKEDAHRKRRRKKAAAKKRAPRKPAAKKKPARR